MGLLCLFGSHNWEGCSCSNCKAVRDDLHDWSRDYGNCHKCGKNRTQIIGSQVWLTENLDVSHYRNGGVIPEVKDSKEWIGLTTGAWCYYENNATEDVKYGKLYNWYAVNDPRGLAPIGYHIPTLAEFELLKTAAKMDGNVLKSVGQGAVNGIGTNTSGFSAFLSGNRISNGHFSLPGYDIFIWSSTEYDINHAFYLSINCDDSLITLYHYSKKYGFCVRCIQN